MAKLDTSKMFSFQYRYNTRPLGQGLHLPVSPSLSNNPWLIVPWETAIEPSGDTESGIYDPNPEKGTQWSVLYGPCWFNITAAVGAFDVCPCAATHLQLADYETDSETLIMGREGWEWFVGQTETNTSHWTGAWVGYLQAGRRMRLRLDYWHAQHAAKVYRAHVEGWYIRP
jgi:hypothetical protein